MPQVKTYWSTGAARKSQCGKGITKVRNPLQFCGSAVFEGGEAHIGFASPRPPELTARLFPKAVRMEAGAMEAGRAVQDDKGNHSTVRHKTPG